jgi:hypothetical protein
MTAKVQSTYYQQLVYLKEPLISDQAVDNLNQQILGPYKSQKSKKYTAPTVPAEGVDQCDSIDYYKINDPLFKVSGLGDSAYSQKTEDPYAFFKQATN